MHDKTESIEQKLRNVSDSEQKISTVKLVVDDSFDFITVSFMFSQCAVVIAPFFCNWNT